MILYLIYFGFFRKMKDDFNKNESLSNDYLFKNHKDNDSNSRKNYFLTNDLGENFLDVKKYEENELIEETHFEPTLLYQEPAYAEICSFFNIFSSLLNIKPISFTKLEKIFCTYYNGEGLYLLFKIVFISYFFS